MDLSFKPQAVRKAALGTVGLLLGLAALGLGLRSCARDQQDHAFEERRKPLVQAYSEHRSLLAKASSLQPNFRELTSEITPTHCREIEKRIRARHEIDPFQLDARCEGQLVPFRIDLCENVKTFADAGVRESQLGARINLAVQTRTRVEGKPPHRLEVLTLFVDDAFTLIEAHRLVFDTDSMDGKPISTTVRAVSEEGLLTRIDESNRTEIMSATPDGTVQLHRRESSKGGIVVERVRGAGPSGWTKAHLELTSGLWFVTQDGLDCQPPTWLELETWHQDGLVLCSRVRTEDPSRTWSRGDLCDRKTP